MIIYSCLAVYVGKSIYIIILFLHTCTMDTCIYMLLINMRRFDIDPIKKKQYIV